MIRFGANRNKPTASSGVLAGSSSSQKLILLTAALLLCIGALLYLQFSYNTGSNSRIENQISNSKEQSESAAEPLPDLEIERLSTFEDHKRNMDTDAFHYLLDYTSKCNENPSHQRNIQDISLSQLLNAPEKYRGQWIKVNGYLNQLLEVDAIENEFGIQTQYNGWVFDSNQRDAPFVVITTKQPEQIPLGTGIKRPVALEGVFLGWWRYTRKDGKSTSSPVVMVPEIREMEFKTTYEMNQTTIALSVVFGLAILLFIVMGMMRAFRTTKPVTQELTSSGDDLQEWYQTKSEDQSSVESESTDSL